MNKILKFTKGIGMACLFVLLGIYILDNAETSKTPLLGKIIGFANIIFFGGLIIWGVIKSIINWSKK